MALPTLDATFASAADLPRRQMLAKWLVNLQYSGSVADYWTLPEHYLWAKIAVAAGAPRSEADYISLPKNYIWSDLYNAVSGSSGQTIDRGEKEALGWIAAAVRGDAADPAKVATYISWPWRYQIAAIITALAVDSDTQSFIATSGATDVEGIDRFVKGVKALGLWNSMVCWPLRSTQNAGTGTTAFSLGGLGPYNGTRGNGPTWGTAGIAFVAASAQRITTSAILEVVSAGAVYNVTDNSADQCVISSRIGAFFTSGINQLARDGVNGRTAAIAGTGIIRANEAPATFGSYLFHQNTYTAGGTSITTDTTVRTNKGTRVTGSYVFGSGNVAPQSTALVMGGEGPTGTNRNLNGTISLVFVSTSRISAASQEALYDLYQQTLGQGLGLP